MAIVRLIIDVDQNFQHGDGGPALWHEAPGFWGSPGVLDMLGRAPIHNDLDI